MKKGNWYFSWLGASLLIVQVSIFTACGQLRQQAAKNAFLKEHPTCTVVYLTTGEGWDGVVDYHLWYKKPNDEKVYNEAWTFVRQGDGSWRVTGRWTPKE